MYKIKRLSDTELTEVFQNLPDTVSILMDNFDMDSAAGLLTLLGDHICYGLYKDDVIIGSILGHISCPWWNVDKKQASLLYWVIDNDYNNAASMRYMLKLYNLFEDWGREQEVSSIVAAELLCNTPLKRIYNKLGFKEYEINYKKEL
jgi:hypothetical protein